MMVEEANPPGHRLAKSNQDSPYELARDLWLDPGMTNVEVVSDLLKPFDVRVMRMFLVSSRVNHVANDDKQCSRPVDITEAQNQHFV
jgi:hypothetical protein